jgi:hypothetical protein
MDEKYIEEVLDTIAGFKAQSLIALSSMPTKGEFIPTIDRKALAEAHKKINPKHCKLLNIFLKDFGVVSYFDIDENTFRTWLIDYQKNL